MEKFEKVYKDIAKRTDGDIYIGVVGPVRTGKSTFIKRFMELLVLPNIENEYKKERAIDELPQSGSGKTIMTTEPKFVPNEAIEIELDKIKFKTRLVDSVGYLVDNAIGHLEDTAPRMVKTPWFEEEIPFKDAAEIGTKKVIVDHSTVGIVITTDGSIADIPREDYEKAEERVIKELKEINKPFLIVLNSEHPESDETQKLAQELENKYEIPVVVLNCLNLNMIDLDNIFTRLLHEFRIERININFPKWLDGLESHELKYKTINKVKETFEKTEKIKDVKNDYLRLIEDENIKKSDIISIDLGTGSVNINIELEDNLFYEILSEITNTDIRDDGELFRKIEELSKSEKEYNKIRYAMHEVKERGYGIVSPTIEDLILEEPEIVKQGNKYGVKLKAKAPSIHMIQINTETEVSPIVGSEKQSEDLVKYLLSEFENEPKKIWESNIFGKSIHELVNEGLQNKLARMPEDAQSKMQDTLQRIVNEGSGGLICIIL